MTYIVELNDGFETGALTEEQLAWFLANAGVNNGNIAAIHPVRN